MREVACFQFIIIFPDGNCDASKSTLYGDYESSLELNSKIKYDELYMKLNSKILQMQLLYETNGEESLLASLENFRHFLINNKLIPANKKILCNNFHKYLNKIILFKNKKNINETGLLYKNLLKDKDVVYKDWLLEKAGSI